MVESACNVGEPGSIPGSGTSSEEGNGNPLQYSCLKNLMGGGAWQASFSPWGCRVGHNWSDFTSLLQITRKSNIPFHVFICSADSLFCDVFHPFLFSCRSVGVLLILHQGSVTTACWSNPDLHQCLQMVLLGHLCSMLSSRKGNCVACKVPNTIWSSTMHSSTLDSAARCLNCKIDYFTFHT